MKHALIVIDMQQGSFTEAAPRHDAEGLVDRLNGLADAVRAKDGVVVFVQHDGPQGDPHHPDLPGWKLLPALDARAGDAVIRKRSCDAFLLTGLEELLRSHANRASDHRRLRHRLLRRHHRAQRARPRLFDGRPLGRPHHVEQGSPAGRKDHRAPQRYLGRLHRSRRTRPRVPMRRRAACLTGRSAGRVSTERRPLQRSTIEAPRTRCYLAPRPA